MGWPGVREPVVNVGETSLTGGTAMVPSFNWTSESEMTLVGTTCMDGRNAVSGIREAMVAVAATTLTGEVVLGAGRGVLAAVVLGEMRMSATLWARFGGATEGMTAMVV